MSQMTERMVEEMVEDDICTSEENKIEIYEKIAENFEGLADLFHRLAESEADT